MRCEKEVLATHWTTSFPATVPKRNIAIPNAVMKNHRRTERPIPNRIRKTVVLRRGALIVNSSLHVRWCGNTSDRRRPTSVTLELHGLVDRIVSHDDDLACAQHVIERVNQFMCCVDRNVNRSQFILRCLWLWVRTESSSLSDSSMALWSSPMWEVSSSISCVSKKCMSVTSR